MRKRVEKNKEKYLSFIEKFETIPIKKETMHLLVLLKEKYELPLADLLIAAQIMEKGYILVTKDRDFENITEIEKIMF